MLKLRAAFYFKHKDIFTENCVVEKTVQLSAEQFDYFSANLLKGYSFIKDNKALMRFGSDDEFHCVMVTGEGRDGGILVHSDGRDYARHVAYVPDVRALAITQSPALTGLCEKLTCLADHLAGEYLTMLEGEDRAALHLYGEAMDHGVDISYSETLRQAVIGMVGERLEGHGLDMEFDGGDLVFTRGPAMAEPEMKLEM